MTEKIKRYRMKEIGDSGIFEKQECIYGNIFNPEDVSALEEELNQQQCVNADLQQLFKSSEATVKVLNSKIDELSKELEELYKRANEATERQGSCKITHYEESKVCNEGYLTNCGWFISGLTEEMKYCPYCGKKIEFVEG